MLIKLLIIFLLIELIIFIIIKKSRQKSLWISTNYDEKPKYCQKKIKSFIKNIFSKKLGWDIKPRTIGLERNFKKKTKFEIDFAGARLSKYSLKKNKKIAVFGDSFVFCRYVNDFNAWPEFISRAIKSNVMNFGVGNFGFDQALLKYETAKLPKSIKIIIIGFVPETISRIHSHWKHYYEHGNIFGFKPFFKLTSKKFQLVENPIKNAESFDKISKIIDEVKKKDIFYLEKFQKFKFNFPYLLSIFNLFPLKFFLFFYLLKALVSRKYVNFDLQLFKKIYQYNINFSNKLYKKKYFTKTFDYLIKRFLFIAKKRKHLPIIVIFPQKYDLVNSEKNKNLYSIYFKGLNKDLKILDLTNYLLKIDYKNLYLEDKYGGHLNNSGNRFVSKVILKFINESI